MRDPHRKAGSPLGMFCTDMVLRKSASASGVDSVYLSGARLWKSLLSSGRADI